MSSTDRSVDGADRGERGPRTAAEADTVYAALTSHVETADASIDVEAFHYAELDDDLQATVTLGDLELSLGLTPEEAAGLRDDLADALDEVEA